MGGRRGGEWLRPLMPPSIPDPTSGDSFAVLDFFFLPSVVSQPERWDPGCGDRGDLSPIPFIPYLRVPSI